VQPEIQYVRIENAAVAYQVAGGGSTDVVFLPEWVNNLEMQWQDPRLARFPSRLASFGRVVMLNTRGIGLSDPLPHGESPTVERWMDDVGRCSMRWVRTELHCWALESVAASRWSSLRPIPTACLLSCW
jgi:pimeloyl-ACP methyl ester carboxylesterase